MAEIVIGTAAALVANADDAFIAHIADGGMNDGVVTAVGAAMMMISMARMSRSP